MFATSASFFLLVRAGSGFSSRTVGTGQDGAGWAYTAYSIALRDATPQLLSRFDSRATHARTLLPSALVSVSFGFVKVRV